MGRSPRHAFTLIELLIVVAIIAILAAIAVPNFLEAQVRSKVSRAHADMRSMAVAIEAYRVDANRYPRADLMDGLTERLVPLTTPVAYLASIFPEPFFKQKASWYAGTDPAYCYAPGNIHSGGDPAFATTQYRDAIYSLASRGPDQRLLYGYCAAHPQALSGGGTSGFSYDPTNGTVSPGEIFRLSSSSLGRQ